MAPAEVPPMTNGDSRLTRVKNDCGRMLVVEDPRDNVAMSFANCFNVSKQSLKLDGKVCSGANR